MGVKQHQAWDLSGSLQLLGDCWGYWLSAWLCFG